MSSPDHTATPAEEASTALETLNPTTGEVIDLAAATTDTLAEALEAIGEHLDLVYTFREDVSRVARGRMDRLNSRTLPVAGGKLKTNAPTTDTYPEPALREALEKLVADGHLDADVVDLVITPEHEETVKVPAKVKAAEVSKLLKSDNPAILRALGAVRLRQPNNRTLKFEPAPTPKGAAS